MERPTVRQDSLRVPQRNIRYSPDGRFETGNPRLDQLMDRWWTIFNRLATIPSATPEGVNNVKTAVEEIYSPYTGITMENMPEGPLVITISEYNPHHKEFIPRILVGHLDVVKGSPSAPEIDDGIVKSHGPAIDNKGPVAAILATTTFIIENNIPHPRLRVVLTGDEETDGQHIKQVSVGDEEMAFIADKSGPIGTIVTGSGGYTGISAKLEGIDGGIALDFLVAFEQRMGNNMIARRNNIPSPLQQVFADREFSIDAITIGPNNSRNTVADRGSIQGTVSCADALDEQSIQQGLPALLAPINATVVLSPTDDPQIRTFEISLHGKAGHTSKAGTAEDDGFVTVFSDATSLIRRELSDPLSGEIIPQDEVRINIGSMSGIRRGRAMDISLAGEARYMNGADAKIVLEDLQQLVQRYGGTMDIVEENGAYQLGPQTDSVQELQTILESNGFDVAFVNRGFGISDANNAPRQWRTVCFSDSSTNPHRSDEEMSLEGVAGLLEVFYNLATQQVTGLRGS